jgi:pimeloyl-ACP methyl ester carboxylesterase
MPYIEVGTENSAPIELYYEDHGEGDPIVLIHGWPLNGASWEKQVGPLVDAGYRVIFYDRRGFGKSSKPHFGYDYTTLTADLSHVIEKLDLQDVTLVGFSMGNGEVAQYLGTHDLDRILRAIFIAPICPFLLKTAENPEGVEKKVFEEIKRAILADRPAFLMQFLHNFYNVDVGRGKFISDDAVQSSWNVAVQASPKATYECVNSWLEDFREMMRKIDIPTVVIHGDADRILPIESTGRRLEKMIPGTRLHVIKDAPHGLIWTHAQEVNQHLLNFLREVVPQKTAANLRTTSSRERQQTHH